MSYNLPELDEGEEYHSLSKYDQKQVDLAELFQIERERKWLERRKAAILSTLSNPEDIKRATELVTEAMKNIVESDLTRDNLTLEPFKTFSEDDKEFFDAKKYKPVKDLHKKVTSDKIVQEGIQELKKDKFYDGRKQMRKKTPNDYIFGFANSKLLSDMHRRQVEQEERLAKLELAQKVNEDKFEQIGNALINIESRLKALAVLGVENKKLEAYRLLLENPGMKIEDFIKQVGKGRATVFRWLKEIRALEDCPTLHK